MSVLKCRDLMRELVVYPVPFIPVFIDDKYRGTLDKNRFMIEMRDREEDPVSDAVKEFLVHTPPSDVFSMVQSKSDVVDYVPIVVLSKNVSRIDKISIGEFELLLFSSRFFDLIDIADVFRVLPVPLMVVDRFERILMWTEKMEEIAGAKLNFGSPSKEVVKSFRFVDWLESGVVVEGKSSKFLVRFSEVYLSDVKLGIFVFQEIF